MYVWTVGGYYGPMFWGSFLGTALVGTTIMQGYTYYARSNDRWTLQLLVAVLLFLDISTTALMAATVYHYFIQNFGNFETFGNIPKSWILENAITSLITCIAQVFFASRIYMVTRQYAIFAPYDKIVPGVFFALGSLATAGVKTKYIATLSVFSLASAEMQIAYSIEEACAVVSDILSTISMCYILASARGRVPKKSRLRRLFFFILNRGILVTLVQIGMLVAFLGDPLFLYWIPFHTCKGKLYTNTLLAMLNSRGVGQSWSTAHTLHLRQSVDATPVFSFPMTTARSRAPERDRDAEKNTRVENNHDDILTLEVPSPGTVNSSTSRYYPSDVSSSIAE
ncbi:hypothetical protein BV22DRAFT_802167 [Leucogyrophana mollusca]|uniref:Uncharacterized protein n=1 Tax=Leucogyrophana mollusca TaxID=85980 RepID=A0ACB8B3S5_9AGAM|nr:hypothetical protein BV22DRAFT_802167 [Leucogyrophana mollusca]